MWKRLGKNKLFFVCVLGCLLACGSGPGREQNYLELIRAETRLLQSYQTAGYLAYLSEQNETLPKRIAKKNKCITAMNAAYADMDQSGKTRYVETWRPPFSAVWQEYVDAYTRLKSGFVPQNDEQNAELQRLEKLWQITMDGQPVLSPDAPLFSIAGD